MALVTKNNNLVFPKASDLKGTRGLHAFIYSKPGVGKTTLAATAQDHPAGRDVLFIDPDRSCEVVLGDRDDIAVFVPENWEDLKSKLTLLSRGAGKTHNFKTLVFDTITSVYYKLIVPHVVGATDTPVSQPQWGQANRMLISLIDDMRALTDNGIHVIFNGHAKVDRDGDVINLTLALTPQLQAEVAQSVDHLLYYEVDNRGRRILHMAPGRRFDAKYRQPRTGPQMPEQLPEPTFSAIFDHRNKKGKE